jgi:hypothetical protein
MAKFMEENKNSNINGVGDDDEDWRVKQNWQEHSWINTRLFKSSPIHQRHVMKVNGEDLN